MSKTTASMADPSATAPISFRRATTIFASRSRTDRSPRATLGLRVIDADMPGPNMGWVPRLASWKGTGSGSPRSVDAAPLRRGDVVGLRSPGEILATLDGTGSLEGLPFMPEMLDYYGRRFTVSARVERGCDTISKTGARRMPDVVLLDDLRCDGAAHGGCQAACRIYWKEAWLSRDADGGVSDTESDPAFERLRELASRNTHWMNSNTIAADVYRCQATEFLRATEPLGWWDVRSFFREVSCRNVSVWTFTKVIVRIVVDEVGRRLHLWTTAPFRSYRPQPPPPRAPLGLSVGATVRVRSAGEIAETLDEKGKLRGLWFDREMLPYCGRDGHGEDQGRSLHRRGHRARWSSSRATATSSKA